MSRENSQASIPWPFITDQFGGLNMRRLQTSTLVENIEFIMVQV